MESIDMLIAFGLVATFMLGMYVLTYYFADVSKQTEAAAASKLDAQEVLKKIIESPGDPPGWTDMNQVNSLGLADPVLPGMLDPRKLLALAADSDLAHAIASAACRINAAGQVYPVTKIGYGIYMWGALTPIDVNPAVYERILRNLFGDDWSKYDIELRIRPALNITVTPAGSQVFVKVDPPGVYNVDVCYVAWPGGTPANPEPPGVYIRGAYVWTQGKNYYARVDVENTGGPAVITEVVVGDAVIFSGSQQLGTYCTSTFEWPTKDTSKTSPCGSSECYAQVTFSNATGRTYTVPFPVTFGKPISTLKSGCYTPDVTTPISACASGQTGEDGRGSVSVNGLSLFAYAYVRGVMLKGVNYNYTGTGTVSLIGLIAKPDAGVYVIHSKLIQNAEPGASICGCDDPGVSALGLRYLGVFLGGQSAPLYNNLTVNPGSSLDLNNVCGSGKDVGGCLIPWDKIGRAKFLIAAVSRNSQGQPPKCGGIPQNDVIVLPLAGGLPPLDEVHFATWRRWVSSRPEALAASHASAVAEAGEITYVVDLWVFRYP